MRVSLSSATRILYVFQFGKYLANYAWDVHKNACVYEREVVAKVVPYIVNKNWNT